MDFQPGKGEMGETTGTGILESDAEECIQFLNQRMADMLGCGISDALGKSVFLFVHESCQELMQKKVRDRRHGVWEQYEVKFRRTDGRELWAIAAACPRFDKAGYIGSLTMVTDVTASKKAEQELAHSNRQLRRLSTQLLHAQDLERRRLARELHDSTAQILTAISLNLRNLRGRQGAESQEDALLAETLSLADRCTREIRAVSYGLHPPLLDELGLVTAIRVFAEGFEERAGLSIELLLAPDFERLDPDVELAIFRIMQEALSNVHRHSGSRRAVVRLMRDSESVRLEVQDEGRGFPTRVQHGVGLLSMQERAQDLGGRFVTASTSAGTLLTVVLPLTKPGMLTPE